MKVIGKTYRDDGIVILRLEDGTRIETDMEHCFIDGFCEKLEGCTIVHPKACVRCGGDLF